MKGVKGKINYDKIKWFFVWFVIFGGLIWISEVILSRLRESFSFLGHALIYFIFVGFMLAFFSRLISSAIWSKHFVFDSQIFYWTLIFACALWLVRFIIEIIVLNISSPWLEKEFVLLILLAFGIEVITTFLKRTSFGNKNRKKIKIV